MKLELINNNDIHIHWGDYFEDAPIMRLKLKYAETYDEMREILQAHLLARKSFRVREIYADGDGDATSVAFLINKNGDYKVFLTIEF